MEVVREHRKTAAYKVHEPSDTDTHRTADVRQRDFLAEQAFHQAPLFCANHAVVGVQDTLPATCLAAMVLLSIVRMAMFLELLGCTLWTRVSDVYGFLLTLWYRLVVLINNTTGLRVEHCQYNTTL